MFKDKLLDYFDRYLKVCSRMKPADGLDCGEAASLPSPPTFRDLFGADMLRSPQDHHPARNHANLWFLMHTLLLIGKSPEEVRKTLYFQRSSELFLGFHIEEPYAICAVYLLLERDSDVLVNLNMLTNMLTVNVLICAEQCLLWGAMKRVASVFDLPDFCSS